MLRPFRLVLSVLVLLSLPLLVACPAKSPQEQVAAQRAQYTVKLNSWYANVENQALDESVDAMEGEAMEGEAMEGDEAVDAESGADEESGDGAEMTDGDSPAEDIAEMSGPQLHTIVFDLLLVYGGRDKPLPGITVLVTHADAAGTEKETWLEYLETPGLAKGTSHQVGFEKHGVAFEPDDQFAVTLQKSVAPSDYADYPEFAAAGD